MIRSPVALCLAALSALAAAGQSRAPSAPGNQVHVHALVTATGSTVPLRGLDRGDFELLSDGRPVPIQSFSAGPRPVSGVVLVDASASVPATVNGPSGFFARAVEESFVPSLAMGDRIRIGSFARGFTLSPEFTVARGPLVDAARRALDVPDEDRYGPSPLWDAIDAAVTALESEPGRRAIFVVTDGKSTGNSRALPGVLRHATQFDTAVCFIEEGPTTVFRQSTVTPSRATPEAVLRDIADQTGCLSVADGLANLGRAAATGAPLFKTGHLLAELLEAARMTYVLGFTPPVADDAEHKLEVRVKLTRMQVRARRIYR
jgi:VWFA-related protein